MISYPVPPPFNNVGSIDRVRLTIGAGNIQSDGPGELIVDSVFLDLRCQAGFVGGGCTDEVVPVGQNPVLAFNGNITTTCLSLVTTAHAIAPDPNRVTLTFTPALVIPSNTPEFCSVEFDVQKTAPRSWDTTPLLIEELAGFVSASCDNGLVTANVVTGAISIDVTPTPTPTSTPMKTATPTNTPTQALTATPTPTATATSGSKKKDTGCNCWMDPGAASGPSSIPPSALLIPALLALWRFGLFREEPAERRRIRPGK